MMDGSFPQRDPSIPTFQTTTTPPTYPVAKTSTSAAYGVLILIAVYYFLKYLESYHLPLSEILWNSLVYLTPDKMISHFDPAFCKSSSQEPEDDEIRSPEEFDSRHRASKSDSMRRLLGLNINNGIMKVVQRTRALSDLGGVFNSERTRKLPGLGNWDHSCYQNSVLQGLASLESLPQYLREDEAEEGKEEMEVGATRRALRELTESLNNDENAGRTFWTPSILKSMSSLQQQDAQEYFSKVMDSLEKDAARANRLKYRLLALGSLSVKEHNAEGEVAASVIARDRTLMSRTSRMNSLSEELQSMILATNPLEGLLAQRVGCQRCGYVEGLSLVPFNCLTVPLNTKQEWDVRDCLDAHTDLESINGVECAKCTLLDARGRMDYLLGKHRERNLENETYAVQMDALLEDASRRLELVQKALNERDYSDNALKTCQIKNYAKSTKSRQSVIARAPEALVIHINRSIFDERTAVQSKNMAAVRFPREFDLGEWCLGTTSRGAPLTEHWNTNPRQSMLGSRLDAEKSTGGLVYELRAVVTHQGRHENGHYICYRQSPCDVDDDDELDIGSQKKSRLWWRLSDEDVREVGEDDVLGQGGVFMLFYEQVPMSPHPTPVPLNRASGETATMKSTGKGDEIPKSKSAILKELEPPSKDELKAKAASAYPTPPPERPSSSLRGGGIETTTTTLKNPNPTTASPISNRKPSFTLTSSSAHDNDTSVSTSDTAYSPELESRQLLPNLTMEPVPIIPSPTSKLSPRTGRGRDRRSNAGLESMGGTVQAN